MAHQSQSRSGGSKLTSSTPRLRLRTSFTNLLFPTSSPSPQQHLASTFSPDSSASPSLSSSSSSSSASVSSASAPASPPSVALPRSYHHHHLDNKPTGNHSPSSNTTKSLPSTPRLASPPSALATPASSSPQLRVSETSPHQAKTTSGNKKRTSWLSRALLNRSGSRSPASPTLPEEHTQNDDAMGILSRARSRSRSRKGTAEEGAPPPTPPKKGREQEWVQVDSPSNRRAGASSSGGSRPATPIAAAYSSPASSRYTTPQQQQQPQRSTSGRPQQQFQHSQVTSPPFFTGLASPPPSDPGLGDESWRAVLGGAYHSPQSATRQQGGGEPKLDRSELPRRRESLLPGMRLAAATGTGGEEVEFIKRPARRESLQQQLASPIRTTAPPTNALDAFSSPSSYASPTVVSPTRSLPPGASHAPSFSPTPVPTTAPAAPTAFLHTPPIPVPTTNGSTYSPLSAFFGSSPTPSQQSTFAPSLSASVASTPPTTSESVFGSRDEQESLTQGKGSGGGDQTPRAATFELGLGLGPPVEVIKSASRDLQHATTVKDDSSRRQVLPPLVTDVPVRRSLEQQREQHQRRAEQDPRTPTSPRRPAVATARPSTPTSTLSSLVNSTLPLSPPRSPEKQVRPSLEQERARERRSSSQPRNQFPAAAVPSVTSPQVRQASRSPEKRSASPVSSSRRRDSSQHSSTVAPRLRSPEKPSRATVEQIPAASNALPSQPRRSSQQRSTTPPPSARQHQQSSPTSSSIKTPPASPSQRQQDKFSPSSYKTAASRQTMESPRAVALKAARERSLGGYEEKEKSSMVGVEERMSEQERARELKGKGRMEGQEMSRFEAAIVAHPRSVFARVLQNLDYGDFCNLRITSKALKRCVEGDAREIVLQRFLGHFGYRTLRPASPRPDRGDSTLLGARSASAHHAEGRRASPSPLANGRHATVRGRGASEHSSVVATSTITSPDPIVLSLRDLDAFLVGLEISLDQYSRFAVDYSRDRLHPNTLRLIRASTRAWNRVILRLRYQSLLPSSRCQAWVFPSIATATKGVFKVGRAPSLRVWVPTADGSSWMKDAEVVECEREVWRSGVWSELRRGDVVQNVAVAAFGNAGRLLSDGQYLRDLEYIYDVVGHLPSWLNMLTFSVQQYHNIVASSTSNPVFYLNLGAFVSQVRESITLCDDRVQVSSPQGSYSVKRFVYRAAIKIKPQHMIGDKGGAGAGPGGVEVAHVDWSGTCILEVDGTQEQATLLVARMTELTPYRILREKSRPGKLWLRPVMPEEAV